MLTCTKVVNEKIYVTYVFDKLNKIFHKTSNKTVNTYVILRVMAGNQQHRVLYYNIKIQH